MSRFTFTSESVSEGHPDKVCDYISDSVLDACLEQDKNSRVACETLCKSDTVVLAGEITTNATLDYETIVRRAVREIGYTDSSEPFCDSTLKLISLITRQSGEIDQGVTATTSQSGDQGAGDQGIMFGYATDESSELRGCSLESFLLRSAESRQRRDLNARISTRRNALPRADELTIHDSDVADQCAAPCHELRAADSLPDCAAIAVADEVLVVVRQQVRRR